MRSHAIFGIRIDDLSSTELRTLISDRLCSDTVYRIVTPNPEFVLLARHDEEFRDVLSRADLSLPDGVGLRFAVAALTGDRLQHRHTGVDTLSLIAAECASLQKRLLLLGGDPGVAVAAAARLRGQHPGLQVDGFDPGRVDPDHLSDELLERLAGYSVVAVGLGQGKQERFMETLRAFVPERIPVLRLLIGIGGAFDMISGAKPRAPVHLRRAGLEWLWRLAIEPSRWKRIFHAFLVFPGVVAWDTLKHHRFLAACRATVPEIIRQLKGL